LGRNPEDIGPAGGDGTEERGASRYRGSDEIAQAAFEARSDDSPPYAER
jgi:hypothetical protein